MSDLEWLRTWAEQYEHEKQTKKNAKLLKRQVKYEKKRLRQHGFGFVKPVQRPDYSDWPAITSYAVKRNYDPLLYGRPEGSRWPCTDKEAQTG